MSDEELQGVSVHAGFPNPAADRAGGGLDIHKLLVQRPASTFFLRADGQEWAEAGIFNGDILVVDKALGRRKTDLVVCLTDESLMVARATKMPPGAELWGVVTSVIHQFRPAATK